MILELFPFDIVTAPPSRLVATAPFWESLPRICDGLPVARLIITADLLEKEQIFDAFERAAVPPEQLPLGVLAYHIQYKDYLKQSVQSVRRIRAYLIVQSLIDQEGIIGLLGTYGVQAQELDHELPRPFNRGVGKWDHIEGENGLLYGLLENEDNQFQAILTPRLFHNLFELEFPTWLILHVHTYPQAKVSQLLNTKAAMAMYGTGKTMDSIREAEIAQAGVRAISDAMARGEAFHTFRLWTLVSGGDKRELENRLQIVKGALSALKMQRVYSPAKIVPRLFSPDPLDETDGTPITSSGVALMVGSALSYRRRTATRGVLLGIDQNQSPLIIDLFDDRHPSYNMVVLGQTGSGKTFGTLVIMLRHLLMGARLIIVDPQGNVQLDFLGDDVVQQHVVGTSESPINILDIVYDELGPQVEMAMAMMRLLGVHSDRPLERAILDEGLMALYEPIWGKEAPPPLIGDLYQWVRKRVGHAQSAALRDILESLEIALRTYVEGSRRELFGRQTQIDFSLSHAVNCYDVSRLPMQGIGSNLRSAMLSILIANINQGIRRRRWAGDRAPIMFFVDEFGVLIRDRVVANYISGEFKTSRARLTAMIVADQDLHSLLGPRDENNLHHGIPILANAANTLIFNQRDSEQAIIREHFPMLPDPVVEALPTLPRGTCVAQLADGDLLVASIVPSYMERIVLSSRLQDRQRARIFIEKLRQELGG